MNNWITTDEKLPNDRVDVLACDRPFEDICHVRIYKYYKDKDNWSESATPGWPADNITHWMPLPDPPDHV